MKFNILMAALILTASTALAEERPVPGSSDPRMRYLAYNPNQVVRLSTAVGATLVVTFGKNETVSAVAVSDSKDLAAMPKGNYLFFKAREALAPQPVIVLTTSETGTRRYVFSVITTPMQSLDAQQPDLYYSVQFTYPADELAAKRRQAAARARQQADLLERQRSKQAEAALNDATSGSDATRNWHYVAQGNHNFLPLEVYDNGYTTVFRFPGNVRVPSLYIVNPDGKEALVNYSVKGDLVEAAAVAKQWKLRDGQTVLRIWNTAYDPLGQRPGTGTVSSNVERLTRDAAR